MNNPKPKFCVGEEVAVVAAKDPKFNIKRTEIVLSEWCGWESGADDSWGYITSNMINLSNRLAEFQIRKLPPEDRTQFSDCGWMPRGTVK